MKERLGGTLQRALNRHADLMHRELGRWAYWCNGRLLVGSTPFHRTKGGMLRRRLNRLHVHRKVVLP